MEDHGRTYVPHNPGWDQVAASEREAFELTRKVSAYLPKSAWPSGGSGRRHARAFRENVP
ncbi:hypothetical protein [Nonomuraea gerenzanensis]|uniref:Uncharacterized protein n=1 Tax=Nonomuraea gerenzanensis TaxID=93944 RepID=A0A1M4EL30_9ACTN|nr:hypothetical protein [Nonomuraea gerenzanensis]UBU11076.1 hypothetical protein LCN96_43220 [Nonomuraea gerenzanensis]SBO99534.1 hypothetical protein BN4615_P9050 [Nonomuraea gerenzanensis]